MQEVSKLSIGAQNRIRSDHLFNAYLIESSDINLAKNVAYTLVNDVISENSTVDIFSHPDVKILEKNSEILISDIREKIVADCVKTPFIARRKFYIICDAGYMNKEASNALLKTLEEPPEYVSIILVTKNKDLLLPTILSRCIKYVIQDTKNSYLLSLALKDYIDEVFSFLSFREKNYGGLYQFSGKMQKSKEEFIDMLNVIRIIFRDALTYKMTGNKNLLILGNREADYVVLVSTFTIESIKKALEVCEKFLAYLDNNIDKQLFLDEVFVCLRSIKNENSRS